MKTYKVWIEIEEIDEEADRYENVEGFDIGEFSKFEEALRFAGELSTVPMWLETDEAGNVTKWRIGGEI